MTTPTERTLYERLGGYDAVAAITDEFLVRVHTDPKIGHFWSGQSDDTKRSERQLIVDFLASAAGGPANYTGRDMRLSHQGLGITEGDYDVLMVHCVATLDKFDVTGAEKDDVCSFMETLRDGVIQE